MTNSDPRSPSSSLPLTGVRVLDLSRLLPGPYCSLILADFGAEVIRVERPGGGDWLRHARPVVDGESLLFRAINRGKKSLTLDLKSDEGQRIFLQLIETADVLVEGFRPGVMERLELSHQRLAEVNPRLIYCSLTGYGTVGPYRQRPGHDLNYIGLAGLLDLTGPREGTPVIPGAPVADLTGALWAAIGILLALVARERTGRGQRVDGSLLGGALACLPLAVARQAGDSPMRRGASDLTGGMVCYQVYETRDGQYVTLAALEPQFWATFCRAVGREDLVDEQFAPAVPGEPAYQELCALFATRTRQEWVERLAEVDACCEPVYTVEEALASAPVQALGMLADGQFLAPVRLSAESAPGPGPAPALGQHTKDTLAELGYGAAEVGKLKEKGVV